MKILIAVLVVCAGCTRHGLNLTWVDDETLKYDPARYPDDAAVVLHRSDHQLMTLRDDGYTQYGRHEVFALQTEGGFDLAEVKVAFRAKDQLIELKARMRHPDGTWEEIDPKTLLSDTSGTGERDLNARFFRFPRIQVGSLLEYFWVIQSEDLWWADDQDSVGQYPVRRYRFDLETSKELVTTVTTYNTSLPIKSEALPNTHNKLSLEIRDIPRRPVEDYAPNWTFTEPRWVWRLMAFDWGRRTTGAWHTWDELIKARGGALFGLSGKLFEGFQAPQFPACADVACKIAQAQAWVRENTRTKGEEKSLTCVRYPSECRPMKAVLEAKRADTEERAVLLRKLLADAGLEAHLALATRHWSAQVDPTFPTFGRFNELLVYLPVQPGLPGGAWLAPRCDYCGVNELPTELRSLQVLVFNATRLGIAGVTLKSEWRSTLGAAAAMAPLARVTHDARIDAAGALTDSVTEVLHGRAAQDEQLEAEGQTDTDVRNEERLEISSGSALARLLDVRPRACAADKGICQKGKRFSIPAYATAESATRWLVPLDALSSMHSARLTKDKEQRVAELHLQNEENFEEVFELEAPAGFVLESVPPAVAVNAPLVQSAVKVEATPKGAKVTRTLKRTIGGVSLARYDEVQGAYRAFQDAKHLVLSFVKK